MQTAYIMLEIQVVSSCIMEEERERGRKGEGMEGGEGRKGE